MVKTRRKGYDRLQKCLTYFRSLGYFVDVCEDSSRFGHKVTYLDGSIRQSKDLFGLFDAIGVHATLGVLFIQCKSNVPAKLFDLINFSKTYCERCCCYTWYDHRGFVLHMIDCAGNLVREDHRRVLKKDVRKRKSKFKVK